MLNNIGLKTCNKESWVDYCKSLKEDDRIKGSDLIWRECDVAHAESVDEFIGTIRSCLNCPDPIIGLDDLYDKITDLYWLEHNKKPIIIFHSFDNFLSRCDSFDSDKIIKFFVGLKRFWEKEYELMPLYSSHESCLYVVITSNASLIPEIV